MLKALSCRLKRKPLTRLCFLLLCTIAVLPQIASAQLPTPIFIGGGLSASFNSHSLSLPVYDGGVVCGEFQSGTSILPNGFLLFERPFTSDTRGFWLAPRLHLNSLGVTLTTPATDTGRVRHLPDSTLVSVPRTHKLDATILALGLDLFVKYPLTQSLFLIGGPSVSYLLRRDALQTETITSASAVFQDGSTVRTLSSGQIKNSNAIMAAFTVGASLDLPVSKQVTVAPELSVTAPITSIRSDYSWHVTRVNLGVAIKFNLAHEETFAVVVREPEKPKSALAATVKISGVQIDSTGREIETPNPQLRVEEFVRREAYPILNEIFFDSASSTLPTRYDLLAPQSAPPTFTDSALLGKPALDIYHETLNILGKRMSQTPSGASNNSRITITGSNSGLGSETSGTVLSRARAESVKDYLTHVWKIDPNRITVEATDLPRNPSSIATPEGAAENRRVEITSSDLAFLDPFVIEEIDRTMNPPKIRVRTKTYSALPLSQTMLTLTQATPNQAPTQLAQFSSAKDVQDWTPLPADLPRTDAPLVARLYLKDDQSATLSTTDSARVEQVTVQHKRQERLRDKIVEHYNLITFDFDKATLDARSTRVIEEIAQNITPTDRISLTGYTDITGDREHNLKLSQERAKNVEEALKKATTQKGSSAVFVAAGEGENNLVDNRLPEGRFLSRTVFIKIERTVGQ